MAKLKRLGVLSVAKIYAVMMALAGFIMGLFIAIASSFLGFIVSSDFGFGMGAAAIVILPLVNGVFGFISGAIMAFLYNIIAGKLGGIEMDFD